MKDRILYNAETGRLCLNNDDLHCGDTLTVWIAGNWCSDRIEADMNGRWYLVNHPDIAPYELTARRSSEDRETGYRQ